MAVKLAEQVVVMFLLMGIGIVIHRKRIVSTTAAFQFSQFVLMVVTPTLLVQVFQRDLLPELLPAMGLSAVMVLVFHIICIVVTKRMFSIKDKPRDTGARYGAICSNCGFMGIPLMTAAMGDIGMLYAAIYIGIFNVYQWTHGIMILRGSRRVSLKEIFLSPGFLGTAIGVILFFLQIRLPGVLLQTMGFISNLNTPLPMVITGILIADISFKELFTDWKLYYTSLTRLLILPLIMLGLMWVTGVAHWFNGAATASLAMVISCACPCAISTVMMPTRFGGDVQFGAKLVALSTLISLATIPLIASIAEYAFAL